MVLRTTPALLVVGHQHVRAFRGVLGDGALGAQASCTWIRIDIRFVTDAVAAAMVVDVAAAAAAAVALAAAVAAAGVAALVCTATAAQSLDTLTL